MRPIPAPVALSIVLLVSVAGPILASAPAAATLPGIAAPVTGNVSGPAALGVSSSHSYYINGTGGPGVSSSGGIVGSLYWNVTLSATNLTGITIVPAAGAFKNNTPAVANLSVSTVTESLTLIVRIDSVLGSDNVSTNITYTIAIVTPYVLSATLIAGPSLTVLPFAVAVDLDGAPVGTVHIPTLRANETYRFTYRYATTGLAAGSHTFTVSVANEHGLVSFANGGSVYTASFTAGFNVNGPPPDYTVWYVAGFVAFFGTLFILATRVAARRRGAARR